MSPLCTSTIATTGVFRGGNPIHGRGPRRGSAIGKVHSLSEQQAAGKLSAAKSWRCRARTPLSIGGDPREGAPADVKILSIDNPGVGAPAYMLRGRVRYENVQPPGYLELLNIFPTTKPISRARFLVRPDAVDRGSSEWRAFELPFAIVGPELNQTAKGRPRSR